MASTTNFDDWLDEVDPSHYADAFALHQAVSSVSSFAAFDAKRANNGSIIVSAPNSTDLVLVSDEARTAFLKLIHVRFVEAGMDIGAWYAMNQANEKDD